MSAYYPIYSRHPNKLLRYEMRSFKDRSGNTGVERVAIYKDKNGRELECTAQVIWNDK